MPLATLLGPPLPWRMVRPWLLDLAREIDAGLKDESVAPLTIEHVWITRDGYAKLLDFIPPGMLPPVANQEGAATLESGQTFLASVARSALDGSSSDESGATVAHARDPLGDPRLTARDSGSTEVDRRDAPTRTCRLTTR